MNLRLRRATVPDPVMLPRYIASNIMEVARGRVLSALASRWPIRTGRSLRGFDARVTRHGGDIAGGLEVTNRVQYAIYVEARTDIVKDAMNQYIRQNAQRDFRVAVRRWRSKAARDARGRFASRG